MKRIFCSILILSFSGSVILLSCKKENPAISYVGNQPSTGNNNPPPGFPSATGPARIFNFFSQSWFVVSGYTARSRYVLYDNGAFALQYSDNGGFEYRGGYTASNGIITFKWEGWSTAGPWGATGTLKGDTLKVAYNDIMMMTDFEDAVYLKNP